MNELEAARKTARKRVEKRVTKRKALNDYYRMTFTTTEGQIVLADILSKAGVTKYTPNLSTDELLRQDGARRLAMSIAQELGWEAAEILNAYMSRLVQKEEEADDAQKVRSGDADSDEPVRSAMDFNPTENV